MYFVYTYSCSVACGFLFVCLPLFMQVFVVVLSSTIMCKQVCSLHCFVFVAFVCWLVKRTETEKYFRISTSLLLINTSTDDVLKHRDCRALGKPTIPIFPHYISLLGS